MIPKNYSIYTIHEYPFEKMCQSLLLLIGSKSNIIKIVFFGSPQNNEEYLDQLHTLSICTKAHFPERTPLISYVSQKPFLGMLNAEVVSIEMTSNIKVSVSENYMVLDNGICRELITGGILPPDISAPFSIQSNAVFSQVEAILIKENFPINCIVRQWNYIENITMFEGDHQHYQDFNDSRSHFYAKVDWRDGYPAATGIGTQQGGVMVEIIAFSGDGLINCALDNPLQIAAHRYSQKVLLGADDPVLKNHGTPKFERARVVGLPDSQTIFISGTAAIRGESSLNIDDVKEQARITMENIDRLISPENYPLKAASRSYKLLRIYVKNCSDMEAVGSYMSIHYPNAIKIYICADVCREELLLEIEGIASLSKS